LIIFYWKSFWDNYLEIVKIDVWEKEFAVLIQDYNKKNWKWFIYKSKQWKIYAFIYHPVARWVSNKYLEKVWIEINRLMYTS
jgi:hypothetical protein